ncbi:hypothetical protein GH714_032550 [Hevea brasiliensis]|uniref:MAR-binding filament-like protein 1 n=1 Tax=Hevea brasiliensis TaxID=3981 RepID=A0A6A6N495_HEVBR|nr:hypothetical protein GH714_032550 [Hevea brasiliensis]
MAVVEFSSGLYLNELISQFLSWTAAKSVLSDLIQEIEPLDVSLIQRDVPPTTLDAMKRTISGMLGLLPSDRFKVFIESLWEPLSKLLVSSMMTGDLAHRNGASCSLNKALFLDLINLKVGNWLCYCIHCGMLSIGFALKETSMRMKEILKTKSQKTLNNLQGTEVDSAKANQYYGKNVKFEKRTEDPSDNISIEGLGEMSSEARQYILDLQSRLSSVKKELHEVKRKSAALQMQRFVGEEKNDLLDYLRSLQPEKVAELSEPTSPELKEIIHSVVHGLLATLSPKMHSKVPPQSENASTGTRNIGSEDCAELVENTSLQFQPLISLTRDYLARLLFWCMLLGHYLRGLEYRMELMELLSLTSTVEKIDACGDDQVA